MLFIYGTMCCVSISKAYSILHAWNEWKNFHHQWILYMWWWWWMWVFLFITRNRLCWAILAFYKMIPFHNCPTYSYTQLAYNERMHLFGIKRDEGRRMECTLGRTANIKWTQQIWYVILWIETVCMPRTHNCIYSNKGRRLNSSNLEWDGNRK